MKTIRTEELPDDLRAADFLETLDLSEGEVLVESHGEPRLVLISADDLRQRREAKQRLFQLIETIRESHENLDADDLLQELEAADRNDS